MKLNKRVDDIEKALVKHLIESGTIHADIKWLKKANWILGTIVAASPIIVRYWR